MDPAQPSATLIEAIDRLRVVAEYIFKIPEAEHLGAVFFLGFSTPAILYLVAHSVGALVNFWRR